MKPTLTSAEINQTPGVGHVPSPKATILRYFNNFPYSTANNVAPYVEADCWGNESASVVSGAIHTHILHLVGEYLHCFHGQIL